MRRFRRTKTFVPPSFTTGSCIVVATSDEKGVVPERDGWVDFLVQSKGAAPPPENTIERNWPSVGTV